MNPSNMLGEDEAIVESDWLFLVKPTEYFTEFFSTAPNNANLGKVQLSFFRFCFYLFASLIYIDLAFKYSHSFI